MTLPDAPPDDRPLRKDAQRTRRLVLDAARDLFADRGLEVGFDEIARRAGVGVGTVYRRFPDRAALVEALFAEKVDEIISIASNALLVDDPWDGIVQFCEQAILEQQHDRGLAQVLASSKWVDAHVAELKERAGELIGELLRRARAAGVVRSDLAAVDLAVMSHLLSRVTTTDEPAISDRYLALFLDAIKQQPGHSRLPDPVPTVAMFEEIASRL